MRPWLCSARAAAQDSQAAVVLIEELERGVTVVCSVLEKYILNTFVKFFKFQYIVFCVAKKK